MKRFLRTLVTLTLTVAVVFTMSVPAFAGEQSAAKNPNGPVYLAFGDSIGVGTKNTSTYYRKKKLLLLFLMQPFAALQKRLLKESR